MSFDMRASSNSFRRLPCHRTGSVIVEFAIAAPIFILLLFGSIEMARLNIVRHMVDNAAYEAARTAIIPGATASEVQTKADGYLTNSGISSGTVSVVPATISESTEQITVTIDAPMSQNGWLLPPLFTGGSTISSSATLRAERYRGVL